MKEVTQMPLYNGRCCCILVTSPTCCTPVVQEMGATFQTVGIPEDMKEQAQEYHNKMIETVVEMDDDILEAYLEVGTSGLAGSGHIKWLLQCFM